jgi:hypothetical protein
LYFYVCNKTGSTSYIKIYKCRWKVVWRNSDYFLCL